MRYVLPTAGGIIRLFAWPAQLIRGGWSGAPVTVSFVLLFWVLGLATSAVYAGPSEPLYSAAAVSVASLGSNPAALLASAFWAPGLPGYLGGTALALAAGIPFERRLGSLRFAAAALGTQLLGAAGAIVFSRSMSALIGDWSAALVTESALGPFVFLCGVMAAGSAALNTLWRRRLRLSLFAVLLLLALYGGSLLDVMCLAAAAAGLAAGPFLLGRRPSWDPPVSSRREARVLIALLVAASAVGPVLAALSPHADGPLSLLRYLFTEVQVTDVRTMQDICTDPARSADCAMARLQLRAGPEAVFMAVLPSILLAVFADGLRRGRRFAWLAALVLQGITILFAGVDILNVLLPDAGILDTGPGASPFDAGDIHGSLALLLPMAVPLLVFLLLLGARSLFAVSAPPRTYRKVLASTLLTGAVLAAAYLAGGWLGRDGFSPVPGLRLLLADTPDRFFPVAHFLDIAPVLLPQSPWAVALYESVGVLFWIITCVLLLISFLQPAHSNNGADEDRARELLRRHGGSALSWMTTWPGNAYWFPPSGESFVAFRVYFGIALTMGPPVGPRADLDVTIRDFARFCTTNGWTPCLYSVEQDVRELTTAHGWGSLQVAEETILPLGAVEFSGKKFQDIRTALNKAGKQGIHAEWISYPTAPLALLDQIHVISEEWVADKGMPEMGFTLGGLDQLDDPEVRCLLAVDEHRTVHAVTSWLPVYRDGAVVGWTLDFMRRRSSGFSAGMEFLIASAALSLEEEGYEFISLSGAPLARRSAGAEDQPPRRLEQLLDWLGASLEPVYGFRSLLAFKAKFQPQYLPLYMVYPDSAALPSIANALARAYLPGVTLAQGLTLMKKILRRTR